MRVCNGKQRGQRFLVSDARPEYYGRSPNCEHQIRDPFVSRSHFRLVPCPVQQAPDDSKSHIIEDLNTSHGTRVNGIPVATATLCMGDKIQVGTTVLIYEPVKRSLFQNSGYQSVLLATLDFGRSHTVLMPDFLVIRPPPRRRLCVYALK